MTIKTFGSMERALLAILTGPKFSAPGDQVGGDFAFDRATMDWYIRIDKVPGGRTGRLEGDFVVDIEVFSTDYDQAETLALAIEALVLGYPHVVVVDGRTVIIDRVEQNVGVDDLPWEDETVHRLGATYVLTARRH